MADLSAAVSAVGALGVGSFLGQYLAGGKDRRSSRAQALDALGKVESARWVGRRESDPTFPDAARTLQTAALLSQMPRALVIEYLVLAQAAYWMSTASFEYYGGEDESGGIFGPFADVVREAAQGLADVLWAPKITRRLVQRRALRRVANRLCTITDNEVVEALGRSREHGV